MFRPLPACVCALLLLLAMVAVAPAAETSAGPQITLVAGSWLPSEGGSADQTANAMVGPFGLTFDAAGTMHLVEYEGNRLWQRRPGGEWEVVAGGKKKGYAGDGGPVRKASFNRMHNIVATPSGNLYISDTANQCVRQIDPNGTVSTFAGTGQAGFAGDGETANQAQFSELICVAVDPQFKALYVADLKNRRIRSIDLETRVVRTVAGNGKSGVPQDGSQATESPLVDPRAVAVDSQGQIYVLERGGNALRVVKRNGSIHTVAGTGKAGDQDGPGLQAQFRGPKHICIDDEDRVIIADAENHLIRRYDPETGEVTTILGRGQGSPAVKLNRPHGVTIHDGALYVVDSYNNRVLRVED